MSSNNDNSSSSSSSAAVERAQALKDQGNDFFRKVTTNCNYTSKIVFILPLSIESFVVLFGVEDRLEFIVELEHVHVFMQ